MPNAIISSGKESHNGVRFFRKIKNSTIAEIGNEKAEEYTNA